MLSANPYLNFMGNAEEAMTFYKNIFNGEFTLLHRFKDLPGSEKFPPADLEKVIHISLVFGKGIVIMATDTLEAMDPLTFGNNNHIHLFAESEAEADNAFTQLSVGGKVDMPMNKTSWGAYFGQCRDKFGVSWMINYTQPNA